MTGILTVLRRRPWISPLFLALFITQVVLSDKLSHWVHPQSFEASTVKRVDKRVASTLRAVAFLSGYKVLVGHVFWLKVIQYYGNAENSLTRYANLYDYCVLASDLNPKFEAPYTFGAAALAFHLKRLDEAQKLLQKGILALPDDVGLKLLFVSIAYQNSSQYDRSIPFLEAQIQQGNAPYMMVNILANTYQKVGRYQDAIKLWRKIQLDSDKDDVRIQAGQKLQELYTIVKNKHRPKGKH